MSEHQTIKTFVFLDLEATGLGGIGCRPKITEISLVAVHRSILLETPPSLQMRVLDKLSLCVYPMKPVEPLASDLTGLRNETLCYQKDWDPALVSLLRLFLYRLESSICLVAHNGRRYDFPLLKSELQGIDMDLPSDILFADSLEMARELHYKQLKVNFECVKNLEPENGYTTLSKHCVQSTVIPVGVKRKLEFEEYKGNTQTGLHVTPTQAGSNNQEEKTHSSDVLNVEHKPDSESVTLSSSVLDEILVEAAMNFDTSLPHTSNASNKNDAQELIGGTNVKKPDESTCHHKLKTSSVTNQPMTGSNATLQPKVSFKLKDVYARVVKKTMANAHRAEDDCLALLKICQVLSHDACAWMDENAENWNTIAAMYPKSPRKRPPLSPQHFPYHD